MNTATRLAAKRIVTRAILTVGITAISWIVPPLAHAQCFIWPTVGDWGFVVICMLERGGLYEPAHDYFTCRDEPVSLVKAGGKPSFGIELNVFCGVHPGDGLPGWTPVDWNLVIARGEYNYDTKVARERIMRGSTIDYDAALQCTQNPWAHPHGCQLTQPLTNNTGVEVHGPFPKTAWLSPELWTALTKWETTPTTEELLADWNPYGQPQQYSLTIERPTWYEVIPADAPFLEVDVSTIAGAKTPGVIGMEWEKIEAGPQWIKDIYMKGPYVWKPFAGPGMASWSALPLMVPVNPGYFQNQPGLYELRVRDVTTSGAISLPARFWIGPPTFEPPPAPLGSKLLKAPIISASAQRSRFQLSDRAQARQQRLITGPRVVVEGVKLVGARASNRPLDLAVSVRNAGSAASPAGQAKVFLTCAPPGSCETLVAEHAIARALRPGETATVTIRGAVQSTRADEMQVFASTAPLWRPRIAPRLTTGK